MRTSVTLSLREGRLFGESEVSTMPTTHTDRCARCAQSAPSTAAGAGLCSDCTRMLTPTIALGRRRAECAWLLTDVDHVLLLHHAPLCDEQAARWGEDGRLHDWLLLSCGAAVEFASTPDPERARIIERCAGCTRALRYPPGRGSPLLDPDCWAALDTRLAARATPAAVAVRPPGVGVRR